VYVVRDASGLAALLGRVDIRPAFVGGGNGERSKDAGIDDEDLEIAARGRYPRVPLLPRSRRLLEAEDDRANHAENDTKSEHVKAFLFSAPPDTDVHP
jgi:hypothetical protein